MSNRGLASDVSSSATRPRIVEPTLIVEPTRIEARR